MQRESQGAAGVPRAPLRERSRPLISMRRFLCLSVAAASSAAHSAEQWQQLPPTPGLPTPEIAGSVPINGIDLWYATYGAHRRGVPVLLLHGGLGSSDYFGALISALSTLSYRVIVLDSRGQGRSGRSSESISYHLLASDVLTLLDRLRITQVDLVGWSDGAIVGIDIAINHPDRLKRLFAFGANVDHSGVIDGGDKNPVFAEYLRRTKGEYASLSPTPGKYHAMATQIEAMWLREPHFDRDQLARIRVPVTVADGEFDEVIRPEHERYIASAIPHANLVILPNVSHFAMLQNAPEFVDAVVAFLKYR